MFVRLVLLAVATWSYDEVFGEQCEFPADHPDLAPEPRIDAQTLEPYHLYEYTNQFDSCHGCVRALHFCYTPRNADSETLFTIEILGPGGPARHTHAVVVHPNSDRENCMAHYNPTLTDCCIVQDLPEPFPVNNNHHYALRLHGGTSSTFLRHQMLMTDGRVMDLGSGNYLSDSVMSVPSPLFFFCIESGVPNGLCGNNQTNVPTEPSIITSPDASSSNTSTITTTPPTPNTAISSSNTPSSSNIPTTNPSTTNGGTATTSTTTTGIGVAEAQESDSSSNTGTVAGVVGAILGVLLVLTLAVSVAVLCMMKKRQRQRKVVVSRVGGTDGIVNAVYGATEKGAEMSTAPSGTANTYSENDKKNTIQNHQYEHIDDLSSKIESDPSPYTLPLSHVTDSYSYAAVGAEVSSSKQPSGHYESESIYEAPASSVNGLYAQFEKIKITVIPSTAVKTTECLGSGQFGTVNRGVWHGSGPPLDVAIKTLNSSANEVDRVKFLQEGAIMGQFRHPNVVKLHGIVREQQTVLLVIELLAKTDLREHLLTLTPQNGEGEGAEDSGLPHTLLSYCRQVAAGLDYLARKGFVHRDIAARNILLSEDHEICKIADFGMSRDLADETYYISSGGKIPVKWTAPEALHYKKYSTASDVWSFGCLMYEIWSLGHKPFEGYTNSQAIKMVDGGLRLAPPPGCPRAIYQLMINCWNPVTSERPTASTITQSLGRSDTVILKWDMSDKPAGTPLALRLGAPLNSTTLLYPDLQRAYLPEELTNNDYEEPT